MTELKLSFEKCGLKNIWSYIQSGNIAFSTEKWLPGKELEPRIEARILEDFGFDIPVIIRTSNEIENILKQNPFPDLKKEDEEKMHVTMLSEAPANELSSNIDQNKYLPDRFQIIGREIFLFCPNGYGQTKLTNTFFENKLKVRATTRNRRTMKVILDYFTNCLA